MMGVPIRCLLLLSLVPSFSAFLFRSSSPTLGLNQHDAHLTAAEDLTQCASSFAPGDFTSVDSMKKAGWDFDFDTPAFGSSLLAWSGGTAVGKMSLAVKADGELMLQLANDHDAPDPDNLVYVNVKKSNGSSSLVASIGKLQQRRVFVQLQRGDAVEISEVYGKIRVDDALYTCNSQRKVFKRKVNVTCRTGQRVAVRENGNLIGHGEIETVKSSSIASVALIKPNTHPRKRFQWIEFSAQAMSLDDNGGSDGATESTCSSFQGTGSQIGLVIAADDQFRGTYELQLDSLRCYASKQGYDLWLLSRSSYKACDRYTDFFFKKHCLVSHLLAERPSGYTAVVVDADVVGADLERNLGKWTSAGVDLQFYERHATGEIAAGNYIAKNTPFTRNFLMDWAEFQLNGRKGPGYTSADNGAIHIKLVEALKRPGAEKCAAKYHSLDSDVNNLNPYFDFVRCTMHLLGKPQNWKLPDASQIKIWDELDFFVADQATASLAALSRHEGPVMHHGIKKRSAMAEYYSDLETCKKSVTVHV